MATSPGSVPAVPILDVAGRSLHYDRRGAGDPLLLIQGLSGNALHWGEPFLELLERDFDVVAFANRGVGRSTEADVDFTIADLAGDAAGMMDGLGWESAHVMGISMGGMIAQELALNAPERIRGLVLGCTSHGGEDSTPTAEEVVRSLAEPILRGDRKAAIRAGWLANVSERYAADGEAFTRFREVAAKSPASVQVLMRQLQAVRGHDASERLERIAIPTLVMHGDCDQLLDVGNGRLVAHLIPGARLEVFEGVGHLFFWEEAERSAQLVREFLAGIGEASAAPAA